MYEDDDTVKPGDMISKRQEDQYKPSLYISYLVFVIMFMDMTIIVPTLWPFLTKFCSTYGFYAWTMTLFSVFQFIGTPILAGIAKTGAYKKAFSISMILCIIGNVVYGSAGAILPQDCSDSSLCSPLAHMAVNATDTTYQGRCDHDDSWGMWLLFAGRMIAGVSGGIIAVGFSLFPHITRLENRLKAFSTARGAGAIAMVVAPGIAASFGLVQCKCPNMVVSGSPIFNDFTLPGFATAAAAFIVLLLIQMFFKDPADLAPKQKVQVFMTPGLWALIAVSFVASFTVGAFQAAVIPLTVNEYHWGATQNGLLFTVVGLILLPGVVLANFMAQCTSDRAVVAIGSLLLIAGLLVDLLPQPASAYTGSGGVPPLFIANSGLLCLGYSVTAAIGPAVFSKLIPPSHRATMMAFIPMGNSVARILGPLLGVYLYQASKDTQCGATSGYTLLCGDRMVQTVLAMLGVAGLSTAVYAWRYLDVENPYLPPHIARDEDEDKGGMSSGSEYHIMPDRGSTMELSKTPSQYSNYAYNRVTTGDSYRPPSFAE